MVVTARWRAVRLLVLYRICATENTKFRPEFYSKPLALKSFLSAVSGVDAVGDVQFLCDGPVPADLVDTMRPAGVIVAVPGLGNSGSYRRALAMLPSPPTGTSPTSSTSPKTTTCTGATR